MSNSLIEDVENYLTQTGMNATRFGKVVMNDPNFVFELRKGRDFRFSTAERVREYISQISEIQH